MKSNVGKGDRILRTILGMGLILAGLVYGGWLLGLLGIILLFTAISGWCPLYAALGISTKKERTEQMGMGR